MRHRHAICAAVLLAGCSVDVNFGGGAFRCAEAPFTCPAGMTCDQTRGLCVGSTSLDAAPDVGADSDGDAGVAPTIPDFSPPTVIAELEDLMSNDDDPTLTSDLLYIAFASDRDSATGANIWTSTRASVDDPWSAPVLDQQLSSQFSETTTAISADGLTFMFARRDAPEGLGSTDIYLSVRPTRASPWGAPVHLESLSTSAGDIASWVSNGGDRMVIGTNISGNYDLLEAVREEDGSYQVIGPIEGINTAANELSGRFAHDGLVFTFHANRPESLGSTDGYVATRADLDSPFSRIRPISAMNTTELDEDVFLSDDLCTLICVTRNGTDQDIFQATGCP